MKHLKSWKQLNELHSDTYRSAREKSFDKADYKRGRGFDRMYKYRKAEEELNNPDVVNNTDPNDAEEISLVDRLIRNLKKNL